MLKYINVEYLLQNKDLYRAEEEIHHEECMSCFFSILGEEKKQILTEFELKNKINDGTV